MGFGGDRRLCFSQSFGVRGGSLQIECRERAFQQPETGCLPGRGLRWFHAAKGPGPVAAEEGGDDGGRVTQFHREVLDADDLNVQVTQPTAPGTPVFSAGRGQPLTRFGIYKIIRRHGARPDDPRTGRRISPHIFRHIRGPPPGGRRRGQRHPGLARHADLSTTNRYAEINTKTKEAALPACEPPGTSAGSRTTPIWRSDETLLNWLASL
jgi:hypothetical protein